MNKRRRMVSIAGLAVAVMGVSVGCGSSSNSTNSGGGGNVLPTNQDVNSNIAQCIDPNAKLPSAGETLALAGTSDATLQKNMTETVLPTFTKATGIKVKYFGLHSEQSLAKIQAGGAASGLDVAIMNASAADQLRTAGKLATMDYSKMPSVEAYPTEFRDPKPNESAALPMYVYGEGLIYNKDVLADKGLPEPKGIMDIFDPVYKDVKIGLYVPPEVFGGDLVAIVAHLTNSDADAAIAKLATLRSHATLITTTSNTPTLAGEKKLEMWLDATSIGQNILDSGVNVGMAFEPEEYVRAQYGVVVKGTPHAAASCIFMNWWTSEEGQQNALKLSSVFQSYRPGVEQASSPESILSSANGIKKADMQSLVSVLPADATFAEKWNNAFK